MEKNVGVSDRIIRLLIVLVIALLKAFDVIRGVVAIVLIVIAVILLLTSIFGYCPLYGLLGISTAKRKEAKVVEAKRVAGPVGRARGRKKRK
jgi:hypothetical protein